MFRSKSKQIKKEEPKKLGFSYGDNVWIESFDFKLGDLVVPQQPTTAWSYAVPLYLPNQKTLQLKVQSLQVVFLNYTSSQFPQRITITADNINGLVDIIGQPTNRIIVLQVSQITSRNDSGFSTRDLIYKNTSQNMFNLGTLRQLKFKIYIDDDPEPIPMPTMTKFGIQFKIIHSGL